MAHPILQAQDALKAILDARPAWDNVQLRDGGPTEGDDLTLDSFWFDDTEFEDEWNGIAANLPRIVHFQLGFSIAITKYGDDERAARSRALTLLEDLMASVKTPATAKLNGAVRQVGVVRGRLLSAPANPNAWAAQASGTIEVESNPY